MLKHYNVKEHQLFFLNSVPAGIDISNEAERFLKENETFAYEEIKIHKEKNLFLKLIQMGILTEKSSKAAYSEQQGKRILVIEPHSDDFAFSCCATVKSLRSRINAKVQLSTIFTRYSIESFLWKDQVSINGKQYTQLRSMEDDCACRYMNIQRKQFEYEDAVARNAIYGIISEGRLKKPDLLMAEKVEREIEKDISSYQPDVLFVPAAIGWHRDHLITFHAICNIIPSLNENIKVFFYEDYPYSDINRYTYWKRMWEINDKFKLTPVYTDVESVLSWKVHMVNYYRTQFQDLSIANTKKKIRKLTASVAYEGKLQKHQLDQTIQYAERVWLVENISR